MYIEFFGLKELPFLASPDSRFLYLTDQVNETLQKCMYMINDRIGPIYVYGPIGTGKTTLASRVQQQLERETKRYRVAYLLVPPSLTLMAFLRAIMDEFEIKTARSYMDSLKNVADWLLEQHKAGIKPVLILDEAHYLNTNHLKLLHFLLNYETSREKLLQMVLFGQTQLADKIDRFPELKSRMYPSAIAALTRHDTESMISFRWFVAGGKELPFSSEVLDLLFRATLGMPREIVKISHVALLQAFSGNRKQVTLDDIRTAAAELELSIE